MDPIFSGSNIQNSLAMSDPLTVLVLLGAVAAAASLSVTESITTCMAEAGEGKSLKADEVITAWLDSLRTPLLK